mgnify:CR=1 FL=1
MARIRWTAVLLCGLTVVALAKDGDKKKGPLPGNDALILDLAGDGVDLTGTATTKLVGGKAKKLSWTKPGTDDAFVVLDCDGLVKAKFKVTGAGGAKLAGKVLLNGDVTVKAKKDEGGSNVQASGSVWLALRDLDTNRDGKVDASDPTWEFFKLWVDKDADGAIGADELRGMADVVITMGLPTTAPEDSAKTDDAGNVRVDGEFTLADGKTACAAAVTFAAAK